MGTREILNGSRSVLVEQNDVRTAHWLFEQALGICAYLGYKRGIARVLEACACVAAREGEFERAFTLGGAAEELRLNIGAPARPPERIRLTNALESGWRCCDPVAARSIWMAGWRMPLAQVIRCALERPISSEANSTRN